MGHIPTLIIDDCNYFSISKMCPSRSFNTPNITQFDAHLDSLFDGYKCLKNIQIDKGR